MKPFRPPLLKRPIADENHDLHFKKTKIGFTSTGSQLVFKKPGISSLPREPFSEVGNVTPKPDDGGPKGYYNVLWRKVTNKKNKTWEGDALLFISGDGAAELQDSETGRSIGSAKCHEPLLPGSTILVAGKEIEVEGVLSREQYLARKQPPAGGKGKVNGSSKSTVADTNRTPSRVKTEINTPRNLGLKHRPSSRVGLEIAAGTTGGSKATPLSLTEETAKTITIPAAPLGDTDRLVMQRLPDAKVDVVVDPLLSRRLRPHQREGVSFLYECVMGLRDFDGRGAVLADEMGLGKTLQTIALLWTLLKQHPSGEGSAIKKALIVCPATLINNWRKEFRKWLGLDRIGVLVADAKTRISHFTHGKSYSVMIVGYEKLRTIQADLAKGQGVDLIIADEAHRLKTAKNKSAQAIKAFPTEMRIFLTGTPLQNDLSEFYMLVETVNPGVLGSFKSFTHEFEGPITRGRQPDASPEDIELKEECGKELVRLTAPFILRRTADVLAKYLPPKTEHVLFCRPTQAQAAVYRHVLASLVFQAAAQGNAECSLQLITLLKKVCNSPSLLTSRVDHSHPPDPTSNTAGLVASIPPNLLRNNAGSTKLRVLDQLLHTLRTTTSEKVVLVSNYTSTLDLLSSLLTSVGHTFTRIDGSTPSGKRQEIIDGFNHCSAASCFAFLLSAKTGGVGINLIGASRLVLFDVDWNPATDLQAMARIHRDGQKRPCFIYRFLMAGGIDEKIWQRQIVKLGLASNIMDQKEEASSFTREDLKDLFRLDEGLSCQTHSLIGCQCEGRNIGGLDDTDIVETDTDLPSITALVQASATNKAKAKETKAVSKAACDTLMAYTHIDTSKFGIGGEDNEEALIEDEVLLKTLKDEGNKVSFIFSKTSA
ncbi:MAG: hypothetical protein Q9218_000516 [Villophora microphyllina]